MKNFKSNQWLSENIDNKDLVILDARAELNDPDAGLDQYEKAHIKGSQYVDLNKIMTGKVEEHGGRHPLPNLEEFVENMKKFGISNQSTILIYDNGDLAMAGRLWWILRYIGLDKVYVLEQGYDGWVNENLEVTDEKVEPTPSKNLDLNLDKSIFADKEDVEKAIEDEKVAIIDSRTFDRYSGQVEPLDKIPGHIPTALNYPWVELIRENKKDKEELEEHFKDLFKYDDLIIHCGSGVTGTVNMLYMEEIGLKPKHYAGGYSDWVSYKGNKLITKDDKEVSI